jgi:VWFA-related protein
MLKMTQALASRLIFVLFLLVSFNSPQQVAAQTDEPVDTVRIDTDLVDLNVSVFARDSRKKPLGELQQKDFLVLENGTPEEIEFFASSEVPFDLVLLLDLSGSTADKLKLIRRSTKAFVEAARPTDRVAVVTFSSRTSVVAPLTLDRKELLKRIGKIKKPAGGTNFWDALDYVLKKVLGPEASRRSAVIVMTDGVDNALPVDVPGEGSKVQFEELLETVKRSDTIVLPIYLDTEREMLKEIEESRHRGWPNVEATYGYARQQLSLLATESGSILYRADKLEDLDGVYQQVIRDLGTVYSIGYRPKKRERDGSWRDVAVQLVGRPDLAARTKRGYYAK